MSELDFIRLEFKVVKILRNVELDKVLKERKLSDKEYESCASYAEGAVVTKVVVEISNEHTDYIDLYRDGFYIVDSDKYQHRYLFDSLNSKSASETRRYLDLSYSVKVLPRCKLLLDLYFENLPEDSEIDLLAYVRNSTCLIVPVVPHH